MLKTDVKTKADRIKYLIVASENIKIVSESLIEDSLEALIQQGISKTLLVNTTISAELQTVTLKENRLELLADKLDIKDNSDLDVLLHEEVCKTWATYISKIVLLELDTYARKHRLTHTCIEIPCIKTYVMNNVVSNNLVEPAQYINLRDTLKSIILKPKVRSGSKLDKLKYAYEKENNRKRL